MRAGQLGTCGDGVANASFGHQRLSSPVAVWLCWQPLFFAFLPRQAAAGLFEAADNEAAALVLLEADSACAQCEGADVSLAISRGWWSAARRLVTAIHELDDQRHSQAIFSTVRQDVQTLKQKADVLLASLNVQKEIGVISCAFQWSQNSSAVFLSVKFAHRWSSPGALEVKNNEGSPSVNCESPDCFFNFSSTGKHSGLSKRYTLNLHFFGEVDPARLTWVFASAGRMTATIYKKEPAEWPRLLKSKERPKNMAAWDDMDRLHSAELSEFKKKMRKANATPDADLRELEDAQSTSKKLSKCKARDSPFFATSLNEFCEAYFPPRDDKKRKSKVWLVLFHSPKEMGCSDRNQDCLDTKNFWTALNRRMEDLGIETQLGAVNCDKNSRLCEQQDVRHMPYIRRYRYGKKKTFYGDRDIDSVMSFLSS